jgi:5'-nucleotidase
LLPDPPDVIVSGMNAGSNAGINVLYSGTVAAAIEGAFYRRTSIALSLEYDQKIHDYPRAARYARQVVEQILATRPADGSLFNVNLPVLERGPIKGVKVLPQNISPYTEKFDRRVNPRGRTYFWASPEFLCPDPHPGTDVEALAEGYITITPLKFDLTDHAKLAALAAHEWRIE